ncbi:MAG: hypothetical protein WDN26_15220 [Chitinophagaceae bacterium]
MIEKYLWIAGSLPFIILGTIHLAYTFFTNKFSSRNKSLDEEMKKSSPVLTKATTMWKAWIGFNASHSSGAIYIGLINLMLAIQFFPILQNSIFLFINITTVIFYLWLAKKFWFSIPFTGILISTCCYISAAVIILSK